MKDKPLKKKYEKPVDKLLQMLTYKRAEGSVGQKLFNERFVQPLMGKPDSHGNYLCEVLEGGKVIPLFQPISKIAFMAHHDTVHRTDGRQGIVVDPNIESVFKEGDNECLGADCTTGVWLILEMIRNKVPAIYIVHTGEECGGIGSRAIIKDKLEWIDHIDFAISLDRFGTGSIITHQSGIRTCSEEFSRNLESILNLNLESDSGGTYTDSYEYSSYVSECTNLSVGYYNQHTKSEWQDLAFAERLRVALIEADWTKLKSFRDPNVVEWDDWKSKNPYKNYFEDDTQSLYDDIDSQDLESLLEKYGTVEQIVKDFPFEVTEVLYKLGYNKTKLLKDIMRIWNY